MKQVIATENKPIKLWLDDIEPEALEQAKNLANLPFTFKHVALMPDAHKGYGMPIGGVLATKGAIIPNAVGVDIGCGMAALKTDIRWIGCKKEEGRNALKAVLGEIRKRVPVGFNRSGDKELTHEFKAWYIRDLVEGFSVDANENEDKIKNLYSQCGTLGGGNHFIEIQQDEEGFLWVMIHSGSRNLGKRVADKHNKIAKELNGWYYSQVDPSVDLAFLPVQSSAFDLYKHEMDMCVSFARANRYFMMEAIAAAFDYAAGEDILPLGFHENIEGNSDKYIDVAHNYARWEYHFGENVIVHRKGATSAREGEIGIIPGSQGTKSYIVRGLGNPLSFNSCSHGAGRRMGRKRAQNELNLAEEIKRLDDQGIIHGIRHSKDLDEAAGAYKDIDEVMANQTDLVEIVHTLTPLAVVKG